jgi:quinol monooxygenase YgiN
MEENMLKFLRAFIALVIVSLGFTNVARAADTDTHYIVTYFEVNFADKDKAAALGRALAAASAKENGSLRFEVLQRIGQPDQFAILEAWMNKATLTAHTEAAHTKNFREKLAGLLRGAYDERPHTALEVGNVAVPAAQARAGIIGVTHVDIVPTQKDIGVALVKEMSAYSRSDAGNLRFEALTQNSRPNHLTVVEVWKDKASSDANESAAFKIKFRETLSPMSGSLYDERFYLLLN